MTSAHYPTRWTLLLGLAACAWACGANPASSDGGLTQPDSGSETDSGSDAGAVDSGLVPDSGQGVDAGGPTDAGTSTDAGVGGDGGLPTFLIGHAESTGQCNVAGVAGPCDGTNTTAWKNPFPQTGVCAVGAKLTSGTYAGSALKMCATFDQISFYQVTYDAQNNPSAVVPISSIGTGAWVTQTLGGPATQPRGSGVETDVVFDPFIGPNGAFVMAFLGWLTPTHPTMASPLVAVSQSPDPTGAWNSVVLYEQTPNDVYGDITMHVGYDANGLYVSCVDSPVDPALSSSIWAWGKTTNGTTPLLANLDSTSYGGNDNLPYPPVHFGYTSTPRPGYILWPTIDNTKSKPTSAPYITITDCDVFMNCQNGTRNISLAAYEVTWTNSYQATLAKAVTPTSITANPGGAVCSVANVANKSGPPDLVMPNGVHAVNSNDIRNFFAVESAAHHLYLSQPTGCVAANKTNGFYTIDVDYSSPASPVLNTALSGYTTPIGAQVLGGLDASFPTAVLDSAGNVIWTFNASGLNQFLGLGAVVKPAGSNTLSAPSFLDSVMSSGTLSAAGASCTATTCAQTTFQTAPSQTGILISGTYSGTLNFESPSGTPLSCDVAGTSPLVSATSTTGTGNQVWGCPTAGLSGLRVRASSLTSGTPKVTFQENYGSVRSSTTCNGNAYPDLAGISGAAQTDPNNPMDLWVDGSVGTTNLTCSWQTRGVSFTVQ